MNIVNIGTYRGIDIQFNSENGKFITVVSDESSKESKSYDAIKKFIDDYKKDNKNFRPFLIQSYNKYITPIKADVVVQVIGIRKDGIFIIKDENGEKKQISKYNNEDWMLFKDENQETINELIEMSKEYDNYVSEYRKKCNSLSEKLNVVTLKELKKQYLEDK